MFSETLCRSWNFIGVRFWSIGYKKRILMLTLLIGITVVCLFVRTFLIANLTDLEIDEQGNKGNRSNVWDEWVREKGLKSIANIWDNCEQTTERNLIGKIVLHFDSKEKLVIATAVANFTAKASLTSGVVHVVAKFHGRTLYDVKHKLCKLKTETLKCPMLKGQVMNIYEPFKLPQYIPKGNYQSTAKLFNEDNVCLAMAESYLRI